MKNRNKTEILYFVYGFMILMSLSITSKSDKASIIINIMLFAIVGVIFFYSQKLLKNVIKITNDLKNAQEKIKIDFENEKKYLIDKYENEEENRLFEEPILAEVFGEYLHEYKRLKLCTEGSYKCSIDDFINKEMIDIVIKKNILNLVAGVMTGLGILGTFIGLSVGLQNFNTGNASEIENSIAPLMDGIKVAFHTSVYGMVFSLVFNYIYKKVLEDAYIQIDIFYKVFDLYVASDAENENIGSALLILKKLPETLSEKIAKTMSPMFEKLNTSLENFAKNMGEIQVEGVSMIVGKFIEEMNRSLGDNFKKLGIVIAETCDLQKQNSDYMQSILLKIGDMTQNIQDINDLSSSTVEKMSSYVNEIEKLQGVINENFMSVNIQLEAYRNEEEKMQNYIRDLVEFEKQIADSSEKFTHDMVGQIEMLEKLESEIAEGTKNNMENITMKADECTKLLSETAKNEIQAILDLSNTQTSDMDRAAQELAKVSQQLDGQLLNSLNITFNEFDRNLAEITQHLSGTIAEVESTTGRVPQVVNESYNGMKKSFDDMQIKLETLVHSLDIMQRNKPRLIEKIEEENKK